MDDYDPRLDDPRDPRNLRDKRDTGAIGIMGSAIGILFLALAALLFLTTGTSQNSGTQVGQSVETPVTRP